MLTKKTYRLSENAVGILERMSREGNRTETAVIESALKMYSDYVYMQEQATIIPQEIIKVLQSTVGVMERRLNNKSNQLLSALAIEVSTLQQVIAASLDIDKGEIRQYRKNAVDALKANQRVFRMEEALE